MPLIDRVESIFKKDIEPHFLENMLSIHRVESIFKEDVARLRWIIKSTPILGYI